MIALDMVPREDGKKRLFHFFFPTTLYTFKYITFGSETKTHKITPGRSWRYLIGKVYTPTLLVSSFLDFSLHQSATTCTNSMIVVDFVGQE